MTQPETARELLHRHGLPEDIIDGALCLHAQELAALQRLRMDELDLTGQKARLVGRIVDLIDPTRTPAAVSAAVAPPTNDTHGLSVQHADALWDAVAIPGPARESFDEQYANVCRVVVRIIDDITAGRICPPDCPCHQVCIGEQQSKPTTPTDRAALRERIAAAIYERNNPGYQWADAHPDDRLAYGFDADAVLAVLPTTDRTAVLREADWIVEHCPDHGCVEPSTEVCHCEIADRLRRMADETATEHRPAVSRWRVETLDNLANEWAPGTGWPVRALAVERFELMNAQAPRWKDGTPVTRRLVRETTTYTVEAETGPAAGARQDGAET
ncbi:hypothetical protein ACWDCO_24455 [Streptomyces albogriseolus]